jgi:hypothetical protein
MKTFLATFLICLISISAYALTAEEEYRLKEKCGKSAEELVKNTLNIVTFNAHYNKERNSCFIVMEEKAEKSNQLLGRSLTDINENVDYGLWIQGKTAFDSPMCWVLDYNNREKSLKCQSYWDWNKLIKPYMEK